jgi:hypothetical protein
MKKNNQKKITTFAVAEKQLRIGRLILSDLGNLVNFKLGNG